MSLDYNDKAQALLGAHGFECLPEPDWVKGEVPDFLCRGRAELWVEVKSLDDPDSKKALARAFGWLRQRCTSVVSTGQADAFVSDDALERDVKAVLRLADRALRDEINSDAYPSKLYALVPNDPEYGEFVMIRVSAEAEEEVFYSCRSNSGRYGRPHSGDQFGLEEPARVITNRGMIEEMSARELHLWDDDFRIALSLLPTNEQFHIRRCIRRGMAQGISDVERIRKHASKANRQFKSACDQFPLPCLLMVFDDTGFGDGSSFLAALYGDRQAIWPLNQDNVSLHYGPNGFWNQNKNRSTSAACYVRQGARPLLVYNFWATHPLPRGLLDATEYVPQPDGTFEIS